MGNEPSTEETAPGATGVGAEGERKDTGAEFGSCSSDGQVNGDSTAASSPRRSSAGAVPPETGYPSAKPKAKAKPRMKSNAKAGGNKMPHDNDEKQPKTETYPRQATDDSTAPSSEAGMARYMTLTGLQELFSLDKYGIGQQQSGEQHERVNPTPDSPDAEAMPSGDAWNSGGSTEAVTQYLSNTLEGMSDMFQKASADAREGAAALYEKAKIEAAHASAVASEAASSAASAVASHAGSIDPRKTDDLQKEAPAAAVESEQTSSSLSRFFTLEGVSDMFRTDSSPLFGATAPEARSESSIPEAMPEDTPMSESATAPPAETTPALAVGVKERQGKAGSVEGLGIQGTDTKAEARKSNDKEGGSLHDDTETPFQDVASQSKKDASLSRNEVSRSLHPQNSHEVVQAAGRAPQSTGRGGQQKSKGGQQRNRAMQQSRNEAANSKNRGAAAGTHSRDEDAPLKAGTFNYPAMVADTQLRPSKTLR